MTKTICLNMIVKNESNVIKNTLNNLCSYINFSYWVIVDTGSTDNTMEIITNFFKEKQINGELHETEWKDFGFNRTNALHKAFNKTDYIFIFDADDMIKGDFILPKIYNHNMYHLKFGSDDFQYKRPLLINNRIKSKFIGVLHEYLSTEIPVSESTIEGNYIVISGRKGARNNNVNKYFDDAILLENAHNIAVSENNELKIRYSFYCAQSYRDCNNDDMAIEWYKKRIAYKGWNQEVYCSYIQLGHLYMKKKEFEKSIYYFITSYDADPERKEGIYEVIKHYRENGKYNLAYKYYLMLNDKNINYNEKLFIFLNIYNIEIDYEFSIIAHYVNKHIDALISYKKLFNHKYFDINKFKTIINNFEFYYKHMDTSDLDFLSIFIKFVNIHKNILDKRNIDMVENILEMYKTANISNKKKFEK